MRACIGMVTMTLNINIPGHKIGGCVGLQTALLFLAAVSMYTPEQTVTAF